MCVVVPRLKHSAPRYSPVANQCPLLARARASPSPALPVTSAAQRPSSRCPGGHGTACRDTSPFPCLTRCHGRLTRNVRVPARLTTRTYRFFNPLLVITSAFGQKRTLTPRALKAERANGPRISMAGQHRHYMSGGRCVVAISL